MTLEQAVDAMLADITVNNTADLMEQIIYRMKNLKIARQGHQSLLERANALARAVDNYESGDSMVPLTIARNAYGAIYAPE